MSHPQNDVIIESLIERYNDIQFELIEADDTRLEELQIELAEIENQLEELNISPEELEEARADHE